MSKHLFWQPTHEQKGEVLKKKEKPYSNRGIAFCEAGKISLNLSFQDCFESFPSLPAKKGVGRLNG